MRPEEADGEIEVERRVGGRTRLEVVHADEEALFGREAVGEVHAEREVQVEVGLDIDGAVDAGREREPAGGRAERERTVRKLARVVEHDIEADLVAVAITGHRPGAEHRFERGDHAVGRLRAGEVEIRRDRRHDPALQHAGEIDRLADCRADAGDVLRELADGADGLRPHLELREAVVELALGLRREIGRQEQAGLERLEQGLAAERHRFGVAGGGATARTEQS